MSLFINILGPSALELDVRDHLDKDDYRQFVPRVEEKIDQHGSVALLVRVSEMKGWTPAALWEDLKFDAKHCSDVSRLAVVAKDPNKEWIAKLSKPFTGAQVEFYPEAEIRNARTWVNNGPSS